MKHPTDEYPVSVDDPGLAPVDRLDRGLDRPLFHRTGPPRCVLEHDRHQGLTIGFVSLAFALGCVAIGLWLDWLLFLLFSIVFALNSATGFYGGWMAHRALTRGGHGDGT